MNKDNLILQCPECGRFSASIKRNQMIDVIIFFFIGASTRYVTYTCCPNCMRKHIMIKGFTYNILGGNILWPFVILPWSLILLLCSYTKGHSKSVLDIVNSDDKM